MFHSIIFHFYGRMENEQKSHQHPFEKERKVMDNKEDEERMEIKKQLKSALDWSAEMFTKSNKNTPSLIHWYSRWGKLRINKKKKWKKFFYTFWPIWLTSVNNFICLDVTTKFTNYSVSSIIIIIMLWEKFYNDTQMSSFKNNIKLDSIFHGKKPSRKLWREIVNVMGAFVSGIGWKFFDKVENVVFVNYFLFLKHAQVKDNFCFIF